MILLDTSAWIEWLLSTEISTTVEQHLPKTRTWLVPTIVQLELAKTITRDVNETLADEVIAFTKHCTIIPLNTEIAVEAAQACRDHGLSTADAIIFATAQAHDAELLTCDSDFADLPGVIYVPKS
ncbi:MAG: type II toxin-antitoxin system VapC family toxin [Rhodospirillaceae bacterium]|nr:type II toxin-antitoxin system VapC family toxin [Rhodospirillaceae bacterium]